MLADEVPYFLKKYFVKIATQRPLLSCEGQSWADANVFASSRLRVPDAKAF